MKYREYTGGRLLGFTVEVRRTSESADDLLDQLEQLGRRLGDELGYADPITEQAWGIYNAALGVLGRTPQC